MPETQLTTLVFSRHIAGSIGGDPCRVGGAADDRCHRLLVKQSGESEGHVNFLFVLSIEGLLEASFGVGAPHEECGNR